MPSPSSLTPNTFAISYRLPRYPYVRCLDGCGGSAPIAQWRRRGYVDRGVINTVGEDANAPRENGKQRIIRAEAEVTILGPDPMTVRLLRKGRGSSVKAPAD